MYKCCFLAVVVIVLILTSTVFGQEYARDIIPTKIMFGKQVGELVEYTIVYSVHTAFEDGEHSTSAKILVNGVLYESIPFTIDPYDGGDLRDGSCWRGSGSCASRSCTPASIKCVDCVLYCSCNIIGGLFSLAELSPGDTLTVIMDPDGLVPENFENNNTLCDVYHPQHTISSLSEWGLIILAVLILFSFLLLFRRKKTLVSHQ